MFNFVILNMLLVKKSHLFICGLLSLGQKDRSQSLVDQMMEKPDVMWFGFMNNIQSLLPQRQHLPWLSSLQSVLNNSLLTLIIFVYFLNYNYTCVFQA